MEKLVIDQKELDTAILGFQKAVIVADGIYTVHGSGQHPAQVEVRYEPTHLQRDFVLVKASGVTTVQAICNAGVEASGKSVRVIAQGECLVTLQEGQAEVYGQCIVWASRGALVHAYDECMVISDGTCKVVHSQKVTHVVHLPEQAMQDRSA